MRVDAVPEKEHIGNLLEISPLAKPDFSGWPPKKNFDVAIQVEQPDPRLRPGMSAVARVAIERVPDSVLVPVEATFQKEGSAVVYVLSGSRFEQRSIDIGRRGRTQLSVLRGIKPGDRIALKDPTAQGNEDRK